MARSLLPLFLLLVSFAFAEAQGVASVCPTITVTGPAGIVLPGDSADFRAEISPRPSEPLTIVWTVSAGVIEKGQGESALTVRTDRTMDGHLLTAYLQITGLPTGCPNTAVGEGVVASLSDPILIDEYSQLPENDEYARLDQAAYEVSKEADWVAVFVISAVTEETQDAVRDRVKRIENHLFGLRRIEREKVRFTYRYGALSDTTIYRISADSVQDFVQSYGESETYQELFATQCPSISVTGPTRIVEPGESAIFKLNLTGNVPSEVGYEWTVSAGELIDGQGTPEIKVLTPSITYDVISASVKGYRVT